MKWQKLGKIFDPKDHQWYDDFIGFAQSPQTIVFDDYVRVYFSIRKSDLSGMFISHIQYVDFDYDMKTILKVSSHPVFGPGKLGCFDEHGVFPMNVLRVEDKIFGYTNGWTRRVSVSVETGIGFAISHDQGETFQRIGDGPILSASLKEPVLVGDPFVKKYDDIFHMWYLFGLGWKKYSAAPPDRIYKIAHATSSDGINWVKEEGIKIIPDKLNEDECQALPTVIFHQNKYHMYFCYRNSVDFRKNKEKGYRIGYAYSNDLKNWTRADELAGITVSENDWDSDMQCYPHIFSVNNNVYMLYNGNEFGKHGFGIAILEHK
jgi:predicted GH43/DUF377 family glycosyl hydrolase